jgi:hypothetical protein
MLAMVSMPNSFSGLGKTSKMKVFVLKMDNYYDVKKCKVDKNITKAVIFFVKVMLSSNGLEYSEKTQSVGKLDLGWLQEVAYYEVYSGVPKIM